MIVPQVHTDCAYTTCTVEDACSPKVNIMLLLVVSTEDECTHSNLPGCSYQCTIYVRYVEQRCSLLEYCYGGPYQPRSEPIVDPNTTHLPILCSQYNPNLLLVTMFPAIPTVYHVYEQLGRGIAGWCSRPCLVIAVSAKILTSAAGAISAAGTEDTTCRKVERCLKGRKH